MVQRRRVETHTLATDGSDSDIKFTEPRVHAFVYEPATGQAQSLRVDFSAYLKDLRPLYDLYQPDPVLDSSTTKSLPLVNETELLEEAKAAQILNELGELMPDDNPGKKKNGFRKKLANLVGLDYEYE